MFPELAHAADSRTVARELGGTFEAVFPMLIPSIVMHLNRTFGTSLQGCSAVPTELVKKSSQLRAMLFETAVAAAEMKRWSGDGFDLVACVSKAKERQKKYYDAKLSNALSEADKEIVLWVADNLNTMLDHVEFLCCGVIVAEPSVPGFGWISNSIGDYACGDAIVEVKCSGRRFSAADYRQVTIYWLLSYIRSLEKQTKVWNRIVLLNPRLNVMVHLRSDELIGLISGGRSRMEVVQAFTVLFANDIP